MQPMDIHDVVKQIEGLVRSNGGAAYYKQYRDIPDNMWPHVEYALKKHGYDVSHHEDGGIVVTRKAPQDTPSE